MALPQTSLTRGQTSLKNGQTSLSSKWALRAGGGAAPDVFDVPYSVPGAYLIGPGKLTKVLRSGGSPLTIAIYDSSIGAIGNLVYSGILADGEQASPNLYAVNGMYAMAYIPSAEIISNGTFNTDVAGWTSQISGTTVTFSSGKLLLTCSATGGRATQLAAVTSTKTYRLSADVSGITGSAGVRVTTDAAGGATGQLVSLLVTTDQRIIVTFTAATSSVTIALIGTNSAVASFDNVSLQEHVFDGALDLEVAA
jgi:hypothetical protein